MWVDVVVVDRYTAVCKEDGLDLYMIRLPGWLKLTFAMQQPSSAAEKSHGDHTVAYTAVYG